MQTGKNNDIRERDRQYIAGTYSRFPTVMSEGSGAVVTTDDGLECIDLGSGIAVNIFGHRDPEWVAAVTGQLGRLAHASNLYFTEPQTVLAQKLCARTFAEKVFFSNSGAEANECAIKTARKYAHDRYGEKRNKIVTLTGSFHGRTITTLSATGQEVFHTDFGPFTQGFVHTPPNDTEALISLIGEDTVAVMLELVQGEGGVNVLDKAFVQAVARACRENDSLLIIDEVQTGNGRCGALYAYERYGIVPDILTTAKGLGGGLPIGATLFGKKCADTLTAGTHGSTFGGNPVCCAGAVSILDRIDDALLEGVLERERLIRSELEGAEGVESVSGLGLLIGVKPVRPVKDVISDCLENGLLVLSAKDKVRLLPPLNIPIDLLRKGTEILKEALKK